jgi:glycosyltransferase involved in cell wall biosynthesis
LKILYVNKFHYLKGGSEKYYFELAELMKEKGHKVAFFSMENEKNIKTEDKEYFVKEIDLDTGSKLKALDVIYSKENEKRMTEALEDFKPDIVHINNFQRQLSASIIKAINKKNIPIVFTAHDMQAICPASAMLYKGKICEECIQKGYKACLEKKCIKDSKLKSILSVIEAKYYRKNKIYKKIDYIIAPSEFIKNQLIKGKLEYQKIQTLHNFVTDEKNKLNNVIGDYAFYFGRLSIEKGILNLIEAIKNIDNGKLVIAGDGPEKEKIIRFIEENELENKVKLVGYLGQNEIKSYIRNARFIVVPSIWYENCPYSILETMEIGKPIIGSRIGGIPELIENEKNGYLYKYDDVKELSERMEKLFTNTGIVRNQGEMSRKIYEMKYSEDIYYNEIMKIYNTLVKEKKNV